MLKIKGENYKTISDVADFFDVSVKSVREWIRKGIIPKPSRKAYGLKNIDIYTEKYLEQASMVLKEYRKKQFRTHRDELESGRERFNNARSQKECMKSTLNEIVKENIFVQAKNYEQEELLNNELYGNHIPFDDFYNPRDDKTAYRISTKVYDYLLQKGIDLKVIEVKNIGDLPLEERNEIKRYHKSQIAKKRKKVLDKLRAEYGPLQ